MPQKIKFEDGNWRNWNSPLNFLWSAICNFNNGNKPTILDKLKETGFNSFADELEVKLTLNGVELPFVEVIEDWKRRVDEAYDESVKKEALQIIKDKISNIYEALDNVESEARDILNGV